MTNLENYFDEILEDLDVAESPMERLQFVLEYGKDLDVFPQEQLLDSNKVPGCTSNVYITCLKNEDGTLNFRATSEALIVGGYIAIIFEGINSMNVKDILASRELIEEFTLKAGVRESLTPTRANAFSNILKMIFDKAKNFK
jgi:cysteine desulfuration protein SufE